MNIIKTGLKGMAMGMAEVVPGVSGGTIAFITGIYEKILTSVNAIGPDLLTSFKAKGIKGVWTSIQGDFLVSLLVGMLLGIGIGVNLITYLIETYPPVVWAFFFGLILASVWYIGRMVKSWNIKTILALIIGTLVALFIVIGTPGAGNHQLWFVFLSGVIAISALILPGVSGSFILLLLGMYNFIIPTVKSLLHGEINADTLSIVVVFGLGCLTGLLTFSRVLTYLFNNYKEVTLATLSGFMLGSLYKLWPWREVLTYLKDESGAFVVDKEGKRKILTEAVIGPMEYQSVTGLEPYLIQSIVCFVLGVVLILVMARFEKPSQEHL